MSEKKLSAKQHRFVEEYLVDCNASAAALRAGYKSGDVGRQLLTKTHVQDALACAQAMRSARLQVKADDVLRELMRIAFSDPAAYYDEDGTPRPLAEVPEEARRAIAGIKVKRHLERTADGFESVDVVEYRLWSKDSALTQLARHLGLLVDKLAPVNPDGQTPYDGGVAGLVGFVPRLREYLERRGGETGPASAGPERPAQPQP